MENEKQIFYRKIVLYALLALVCGGLSLFLAAVLPFSSLTQVLKLNYSGDATKVITFELKTIVLSLIGFALTLLVLLTCLFVIKIENKEREIKGRNIGFFAILAFFGLLAYVVLSTVLMAFKLSPLVAFFLTGTIVTIYHLLNYQLYFEDKANSNQLFWEIYRFALVGLIAAVFDFIVCYLVQFIIFKNATDWYVTFISVTCGFIVGVTINYFLSTYMVYKASKSNVSKTAKGVVTFVVLSAIGLGIGIGVQYFLYDLLNVQKEIAFFSYPVDFVIRTLIVMVYNYISRKLIIYR